jgi:flagellar hook assembly protein FlgD
MLKTPLHNNEKCFWTIETTFGNEKLAFKWPLQEFVAELPTYDVSNGRTVYAGPNGKANVPKDAADDIQFDNHTIHSMMGGREVLGGAVYQLVIEDPPPRSAEAQQFRKPVKLTLRWKKDEDPGDATPGIYHLSPETGTWELVGTKRVGKRDVVAMVTRPGSYALMIDKRPPTIEETLDYPDPFPAALKNATWRLQATLSEPAAVTVQILDGAGKLVRTLLKDARKPGGPLEVQWDGKADQGPAAGANRTVADGVYTYRLLARDESKLDARPLTGTVKVFSGALGAAKGKVKLPAKSEGTPHVEVLHMTLATDCDAEGKYWLIGLPQGKHTLRFSARAHFEEEAPIELKNKGDDVELPAVTLTNVAIEKLRSSSEIFTPDGDGERDYVAVRFAVLRKCPLDILVYAAGTPAALAHSPGPRPPHANVRPAGAVAALQQGKTMAKGDGVILWHGLDDEAKPLPSGWYCVRFVAHSRTEVIPQAEIKVLLDRGLVRNAHAFPYTFSPNDDGFEDSLEIGYNLENDALVTIRLLRKDGSLLKELAADLKQKKGWNAVTWDGKSRVRGTETSRPQVQVVPDGRYAFEIRPKYPTGHESKVVKGEFMADSQPPEIGELTPANGSIVEKGMPTIRAKVLSDRADLDPSQLKIKIDELTVLADTYDEKTGVFSFTPKTSLGEGIHIAIAYAQDWAGNYAPPQAVSFQIALAPAAGTLSSPKRLRGKEKFLDRTKPEVLSLQPSKNAVVYTPTPLITARVRDTESGIDPNNILIHINGERVSNAVRKFIPGKSGEAWDWYSYQKSIVLYDPLQGEVRYVPLERLKEGKNHVAIEVTDRAGNRSAKAEAVFNVVIDEEPPTVSELRPASGATLAKPEVVVSARLADAGKSGLVLDSLRLAVDGRAVVLDPALQFDKKSGRLTLPLGRPVSRNAQHAISLTVRDHAGNLSEPAVSVFNVVEDGDPPRIDVLAPAAGAAVRHGAATLFAAALYDVGRSGVDEASIVMTFDGKRIRRDDPKTPAIDGYRFVRGLLTHKLEALGRGPHVVSLGVKDRAGNPAKAVVWRFEVK